MKPETSLRRRVAAWLLPALLLLLAINAVLSYLGALVAVNRAYDRSLTASIKSIAERVHSLEGEISVDVPYSAFEVFEAGVQERIFYAVIGPDGKLVTGYEDLAPPPGLVADGPPVIADGDYRGEGVRIGAISKRLYDPAQRGGDTATIVFAETIESRIKLARALFLDSLQRQLLLVVIGAIVLAFALSSAFRPLLEMRDTVIRRDAEDLTPIAREGIPSEVLPLIDAINHHTERLSGMLAARRRFLADAAHQIRTPLAVLGTQAEYGLRVGDAAEMRRTFEGLLTTVRDTRRMADQMLALSQAEFTNRPAQHEAPVDLSRLAREVALELTMVARKKPIDLAFEDGGEALIAGDPQMLHELIANLLDNAIRYSPEQTQVVIATGATDDAVALCVSDQGPGIPAAEHDKVFQRFYRILGQDKAPGSGLGLAIVREIAIAHGGQITLDAGADGRGLTVLVEFPRVHRSAVVQS
ncbi:sensor histidine kinase [Cognatazoarcus halotolerans]|uniref:sensor histidine kinase n=1 Tax=Cognatazoarcus halotolerans TaxID=2686016 RepID=UPI001356A71E|nr:sensor histidine kinase [Cognatazoarcus halotolerans]MCB1899419.1 sensor histidine kinase N-terminal domain-containing protein [Rhodocyclaceae bacterium]MCP5307788.1 sensor histidine kinase N-terminal domain-containing protein [Zoogloeaceae bacterium]